MKNRLEFNASSSEYQDFLSYSTFSNLDVFTGKAAVKHLIDEYVKEKINRAREEGYEQAQADFKKEIKEIINTARTEIDNYISLVTRIADYTYERSKEISKESFQLLQTRTNFYFGTRRIKILFIINTDFEKEISFSNLLIEVEKDVFEKENFLCELLYINKKGIELNEPSIDCDFPLTRIRKDKE